MLVIPPHLPLEKGGKFPRYEEGMKGCVPLFSKEGQGRLSMDASHNPPLQKIVRLQPLYPVFFLHP